VLHGKTGFVRDQATLLVRLHLESGSTWNQAIQVHEIVASSRARLRYNCEQSTLGIKLHPAQDTYGIKLHIILDMWDLTASRSRLHLESGNIWDQSICRVKLHQAIRLHPRSSCTWIQATHGNKLHKVSG
jgi:hypothetical protein